MESSGIGVSLVRRGNQLQQAASALLKVTRFALAPLLALAALSCGGGNAGNGGLLGVDAIPTVPKFLIAVDGSGAGTNVNVFPVDATSGVLGPAVGGSPFDLGLTDGMTLAVHPNGHFVYAADGSDGSIHAWNVSETTGVPSEIATKVVNESGDFFEPCCRVDDAPTHVIALTPNGRYLYSANNDATVGAYKINPDGSLTHISDLNVGACHSGAITANDNFVWVTDTCNDGGPWRVWTSKIGATGALTKASSVTLTGVYSWLWSIQVNPAVNFLYVGDAGGGHAQLYSFSVAADGALTQLGPQADEKLSDDCRNISHSPDGKFFYTTDGYGLVHALAVNTATGAISELSASPYYLGGDGQVVVDLTGRFVYMGDEDNSGQIVGYLRDRTSGALSPIGGSTTASGTTTANGKARAVAIVR
jgi:6-phosphogluconolactonase (cycloisomerase 2 family)